MKILLGVSGSISAYKALDICRGFVKEGHEVKVILTKGAEEFVHFKTFHYLGAKNVYRSHDDFTISESSNSPVLHIDLVKWCDRLIIAPASANTIAKLANGFCDDLLSSVFLALGHKTCVVFPAMNTNMLSHPNSNKNLESLKALSNIFIHPTESGELACGDVGLGKLPGVETIIDIAPLIFLQPPKKSVMITTGATIAPLDPVRYLTNPSTGLTGYELAKVYLAKGFKVILVHGHHPHKNIMQIKHHPHLTLVEAKTTQQMLEKVDEHFDSVDTYISTAAMSDLSFDFQDHKVKKSDFDPILKVHKAPDVLATMLQKKKNQKIVGFAAETDCSEKVFLEKWNRKPVDLLIGNPVNNGINGKENGFGVDQNEYYFITNGKVQTVEHLSKQALAYKIMETIND
jgi:phosphopantothenoylcysteine decarboxylase/phosphopantothenate--cysteine ligase